MLLQIIKFLILVPVAIVIIAIGVRLLLETVSFILNLIPHQ